MESALQERVTRIEIISMKEFSSHRWTHRHVFVRFIFSLSFGPRAQTPIKSAMHCSCAWTKNYILNLKSCKGAELKYFFCPHQLLLGTPFVLLELSSNPHQLHPHQPSLLMGAGVQLNHRCITCVHLGFQHIPGQERETCEIVQSRVS